MRLGGNISRKIALQGSCSMAGRAGITGSVYNGLNMFRIGYGIAEVYLNYRKLRFIIFSFTGKNQENEAKNNRVCNFKFHTAKIKTISILVYTFLYSLSYLGKFFLYKQKPANIPIDGFKKYFITF